MNPGGRIRAESCFTVIPKSFSAVTFPLAMATMKESLSAAGLWYGFKTNEKYKGGKKYSIKSGFTRLRIFIKKGTILPQAKPVEYIAPDTEF